MNKREKIGFTLMYLPVLVCLVSELIENWDRDWITYFTMVGLATAGSVGVGFFVDDSP